MRILVAGLDPAFSNIGMSLAMVDITNPNQPQVEILDLHLIHTAGVKKVKHIKGAPKSRISKVRKNTDDLRRAREGRHGIRLKLIEWELKYGPIRAVLAEIPFGSQSARASWALGIAIGVIASIDHPLIELTPRQVKTASGDKDHDKADIIAWAMDLHPGAPWVMRKLHGVQVQVAGDNEHLADSVAAIHAGVITMEFKLLVK